MGKRLKRSACVLLCALCSLLVAGVAYAYADGALQATPPYANPLMTYVTDMDGCVIVSSDPNTPIDGYYAENGIDMDAFCRGIRVINTHYRGKSFDGNLEEYFDNLNRVNLSYYGPSWTVDGGYLRPTEGYYDNSQGWLLSFVYDYPEGSNIDPNEWASGEYEQTIWTYKWQPKAIALFAKEGASIQLEMYNDRGEEGIFGAGYSFEFDLKGTGGEEEEEPSESNPGNEDNQEEPEPSEPQLPDSSIAEPEELEPVPEEEPNEPPSNFDAIGDAGEEISEPNPAGSDSSIGPEGSNTTEALEEDANSENDSDDVLEADKSDDRAENAPQTSEGADRTTLDVLDEYRDQLVQRSPEADYASLHGALSQGNGEDWETVVPSTPVSISEIFDGEPMPRTRDVDEPSETPSTDAVAERTVEAAPIDLAEMGGTVYRLNAGSSTATVRTSSNAVAESSPAAMNQMAITGIPLWVVIWVSIICVAFGLGIGAVASDGIGRRFARSRLDGGADVEGSSHDSKMA